MHNSFSFRIGTLDEAPFIIREWATKTVSLLTPNTIRPGFATSQDHLVLHFDDVDRVLPSTSAAHHLGYRPPTMAHLDALLDFTRSLTADDRLFVHCHAGHSRSTAAMIAILIQHGATLHEALEQVMNARQNLWPNALIVEHTDKKFGLDGALIQHVAVWKDSRARSHQ